jgi:hypothetical protein
VSVVFPWSMCPMVPMLMCGFVRSNFAFATEAPPGCTPRRSRGVSFFGYWSAGRFDPA